MVGRKIIIILFVVYTLDLKDFISYSLAKRIIEDENELFVH